METEFDDSIIDKLLETAEENNEENEEEEELEIERKYYQKPDTSSEPLTTADFLQSYLQGMG
tara:strand:+ start:369 stop:554 length:186 start_codon:yes stop_codon:yes gene_type:complete